MKDIEVIRKIEHQCWYNYQIIPFSNKYYGIQYNEPPKSDVSDTVEYKLTLSGALGISAYSVDSACNVIALWLDDLSFDLSLLANFKYLRFICIHGTYLEHIFNEEYNCYNPTTNFLEDYFDLNLLKNNTQLETIDFIQIKLSNSHVLGTFKKLKNVEMWECEIEDFTFIKNLQNLTMIKIFAITINNIPKYNETTNIEEVLQREFGVDDLSISKMFPKLKRMVLNDRDLHFATKESAIHSVEKHRLSGIYSWINVLRCKFKKWLY